jgi:hypothetical protein
MIISDPIARGDGFEIALCFFGSQKEFHNPKKETVTTKFNSTSTLRVWVWGWGVGGDEHSSKN